MYYTHISSQVLTPGWDSQINMMGMIVEVNEKHPYMTCKSYQKMNMGVAPANFTP